MRVIANWLCTHGYQRMIFDEQTYRHRCGESYFHELGCCSTCCRHASSATLGARTQSFLPCSCPRRRRHSPRLFTSRCAGEHPPLRFAGRCRALANVLTGCAGSCMAHARRKFFDLHASNKSQIIGQALSYISALYDVEREVKNLTTDERLRICQDRSRPLADGLLQWMELQRKQITDGSATAKALGCAHALSG